MRMQPWEAAPPIDQGLLVPWKPTALVMPIQRATSGLPGDPPGTTCPAWLPAHEELGTDHAGLTDFERTRNRPVGVGHAGWPTATRYVRIRRRWLNRRARRPARETVTIGPVMRRSRRWSTRAGATVVYARRNRGAVHECSAVAMRSSRLADLASLRPWRGRDARRRRT